MTVDEAMVFRLAVWMAKHDGCEDPHRLIYEGSPPVPWGEVWNRYEYDARAALTTALAQQPAAPSGAALGDLGMQDDTMKYDPATGEQRPYPSHAEQWRRWHGLECAWLFDPWTGRRRNARDVGSDINGRLIVPAGTLGGDMNCGAPMQNTANT